MVASCGLLLAFLALPMAVLIAAQPMIAEEIQLLPDCARQGESYLTAQNRSLLAGLALLTKEQATGSATASMKYDCELEFMALFYMKNPVLYNFLASKLTVTVIKVEGKARTFSRRAITRKMVKRLPLFKKMGYKEKFGCNYGSNSEKYQVVCLFV